MSDAPDPEERFLDHVIAPLVRDQMLWPILAVFVGHLVAGLAYALVFSVIERRPVAWIATALAIFGTVQAVRLELRVRRRPAALTGILATTWAISIAVAVLGHRHGVF
jgi:hypothetical protein